MSDEFDTLTGQSGQEHTEPVSDIEGKETLPDETDSFAAGRQAAMEEKEKVVQAAAAEPKPQSTQSEPEQPKEEPALGVYGTNQTAQGSYTIPPVYCSNEPVNQGNSNTAGSYSTPGEQSPFSGGAQNAGPYGQNGYNQQYSNQYQQGPYGQPNNGNPYQQPYGQYGYNQGYQPYAASGKGDGIGFGVASLVLGILSLLCFSTCINLVLAIAAIVLGIVQLVTNHQKGLAIGGIVTAGIAIFVSIIFWVAMFGYVGDGSMEHYLKQYENMLEEEDVQDMDDIFSRYEDMLEHGDF